MGIPESQFENWKSTGADHGSKEAADAIERLLHLDRSPVQQSEGTFEVRRQGSYKNTTHTRGSSDVDVIVKLTSAWRKDISELSNDEIDRYEQDNSSASYGYNDFRSDVWNWLSSKFDSSVIRWDGKAIEISSESGRLSVDGDVVPCIEYRCYKSYPEYGNPAFTSGMSFKPRHRSEWFINYPQVHYANGCAKHSNFKETVRIFKNARDYYNNHFNTPWTIGAHSYGIECLIYNVPDHILKRTNRSDRFDEILTNLEEVDLSSFSQVSEMEPLFGDSNTQWEIDEADYLINRLREMWREWYNQRKNAQLFH